MTNKIQSIPLDKLIAHPDNPNKMSKTNFAKLVRNIERTGLYEPLIARPHPEKDGHYQIINGHHRCKALAELGYKKAEVMVWDVNDQQTAILLATLNRLGGSDELSKKLVLLKKLNEKMQITELSKILPQSTRQLRQLINLKPPTAPAKINLIHFANPLAFFVTDIQKQKIEDALSIVEQNNNEKTKAAKKAAALTYIAQYYLNSSGISNNGRKKETD